MAACLAGASQLTSAAALDTPFRALDTSCRCTTLSPIISGLYADGASDAQIAIHDAAGTNSWTWSVEDAENQADMPSSLLSCIQARTAVPEVKWANGGKSVLSIYNAAAVMINHLPGEDGDKQVTFGVCLNRDGMGNTHSLELVPGGRLAVATTSSGMTGNIKVFDLAGGMDADADPVQELDGLPGVHGLVWDEQGGLLWGSGSSAAPDGESASAPALNAYRYADGSFDTQPAYAYNISAATVLDTEWEGTGYAGWWDGGHDLAAVPGRRQLLVSTDMDLHVFDIPSETFASGAEVAEKYLAGFAPVDSRVGDDGVSLPRSDVKSLSVDGNYNVLYVQAAWYGVTSYQVNLLKGGSLKPPMTYSQEVYRSRWFADTPSWSKARLPEVPIGQALVTAFRCPTEIPI